MLSTCPSLRHRPSQVVTLQESNPSAGAGGLSMKGAQINGALWKVAGPNPETKA